jgi:hypothetical protein
MFDRERFISNNSEPARIPEAFWINPPNAAPFVDKRTGGHWDITGRGVGGGPMLPWLDGVQVKWFAWAAAPRSATFYIRGGGMTERAKALSAPLSG